MSMPLFNFSLNTVMLMPEASAVQQKIPLHRTALFMEILSLPTDQKAITTQRYQITTAVLI